MIIYIFQSEKNSQIVANKAICEKPAFLEQLSALGIRIPEGEKNLRIISKQGNFNFIQNYYNSLIQGKKNHTKHVTANTELNGILKIYQRFSSRIEYLYSSHKIQSSYLSYKINPTQKFQLAEVISSLDCCLAVLTLSWSKAHGCGSPEPYL